MNGKIDTIRLRVLHTQYLTVNEIAEKMNTTPARIEMELIQLGYKPRRTRDKPEPYKLLAEKRKEPAQAATCTSSREKK